jgi:selenide, water dikinase
VAATGWTVQASDDVPVEADVVLIGGGHAHALVLRSWAMDPLPGVRLTLIDPSPATAYTGMLPGLIAGHYRRDEVMIDLYGLCRMAGARFIRGRSTGIDRDARAVRLQDGASVAYDLLSLDVGVHAGPRDLDGALPVRPLGSFATEWERFVDTAGNSPRVNVIGGGLAGVELAMAVAHRLKGREAQVRLVEAARVLSALRAGARAQLRQAVVMAGIAMVEGGVVPPPADLTIAAAGAVPQAWLGTTGLTLADGFVCVDGYLRTSDPAILAAGDCVHLTSSPRPKAGVFAVRAAPVLFHNLRATFGGTPLRKFRPQADYLKLVSLGDRRATAIRGRVTLSGRAMWTWKDRIDRAFMDKLTGPLPINAVPRARLPASTGERQPLCGGCGAKVGPGALSGALSRLPAVARPDVVAGAGDDAATLLIGGQRQVIATDHLRAIFPDPGLMGRIAATHALGDIWAMGAAPQAALAQIILPRASDAIQARMLDEVMQAAGKVFAAAGAAVVGGHTTMGAELTVGFAVTGLVDQPIPKRGGQAGDALILTKPLGTGTILAAEMALARVPGLILAEAVAGAIDAMLTPLGPMAAVLAPHAHAMTDVTGFGLAGHLAEMLNGSGLGVTLRDVPVLPGALTLAAAGHASTIAPANRAAVAGWATLPDTPLGALLVDPQTCGGLLAAVPAAVAAQCIAALGGQAAIIGHLDATPGLRVQIS